MPRLVYLPSVRRDLVELSDGIAQASGSITVARRFVESIRVRCRELATLPGTLGSARPDLGDTLRSTPHRGYVIVFRYREGWLEVVRAMNARRDVAALFDVED